MGGEIVERGGHRAGDAAFHIHRAAAEELAVCDLAGERRMRPAFHLARRHHVGMPGEDDVRRGGADTRIKIFDVGGAGLAEGHAMHGEAGAFSSPSR